MSFFIIIYFIYLFIMHINFQLLAVQCLSRRRGRWRCFLQDGGICGQNGSCECSTYTTQIILIILGNRRKYIAGAWIRFTLWSTYLLADLIALMAAGIISNDVGEVYNANGLGDEKYALII